MEVLRTGYEPLNTLKPVAPDIWVIDGPAIRFYGLPFSTRATVVRLAGGDLWVHSPTALTEALAEDLRRYAAGDGVLARRPGTGEQFLRWVKRNRPVVVAVAVAAPLLLLVGARLLI